MNSSVQVPAAAAAAPSPAAPNAVSAAAMRPHVAAVSTAPGRDLRLDLFRGLALWLIFLDHVPNNILAWFTIRNYGFSDATEIFIFISGYTAAFVYGRAMLDRGFVVASARIWKRAWQIYVAHVFLFAIYIAEISYVASSFENPLYVEEMNALDFLKAPDTTIIQALLLKFKPANMDVLPLYIILLMGFPLMLWLLLRRASVALALSVGIYVLAWEFGLNLTAYPNGHWYFNPMAWQLLFVFGAWCALGGAERLGPALRSPWMVWVAGTYLVLAFGITLTWYFAKLSFLVPQWLGAWLYPIDKTNLDVLRFAHFLALAALTVHFVSREAAWLRAPIWVPAIRCGQHSLEIFCLGVFLAFAAHFVMVEFYGGAAMQVVVSLAGVAIMIAVGLLISWYKKVESRSGTPKRQPDADLAGGEA